jgi:hypothetical protein
LGKAIVIIGETIIGTYDNIGEAYKETLKTRYVLFEKYPC